MYSIVVDFGGTYIKIGLITKGNLIDFTRQDSFSGEGLHSRLDVVEKTITTLLRKNHISVEECIGIGVAMPGIIDSYHKKVLDTNKKYNDAVHFSFEKWSKNTFGLPVILENDARAALKGEMAYGAIKNETDAVMVIFGTGIGTAVCMNGEILKGKHFQAGNLGGHITTNYNGLQCTCGNIGCVEAQSANWALPNIAVKRPGYSDSLLAKQAIIDYKSIITCSQESDSFSVVLLDELIEQWSSAIVNLIHAYDPETIVLSGGLMNSQHLLLPKIRERVHKRAWTPWGSIKFVVSATPDVSALLGLSALLSENFLEECDVSEKI